MENIVELIINDWCKILKGLNEVKRRIQILLFNRGHSLGHRASSYTFIYSLTT